MLRQAIVIVSLVGICWAVACWVPFAIIMEVRVLHTFWLNNFDSCQLSSSKSENTTSRLNKKRMNANGRAALHTAGRDQLHCGLAPLSASLFSVGDARLRNTTTSPRPLSLNQGRWLAGRSWAFTISLLCSLNSS